MKIIQGINFFENISAPTVSDEYDNYYGSTLVIEVSNSAGQQLSIEGKIGDYITEWTPLAVFDLGNLSVATSITTDGLYAVNMDGIRHIRANNKGAQTAFSMIGRITDTPMVGALSGGGGGTPGKDGRDGKDGSMWYTGTAITGTSTTPTAFNTGISSVNIGDLYLNTDTGDVYKCTIGGNQTTAMWIWISNIKGPEGTGSGVDEEAREQIQKLQESLDSTNKQLEDLEVRVEALEKILSDQIVIDGGVGVEDTPNSLDGGIGDEKLPIGGI